MYFLTQQVDKWDNLAFYRRLLLLKCARMDEYQDINEQRYKLIKELLDQNPKCKLFCVGDDWQSMIGFAVSNLKFLVNSEKYFDNPAVTENSINHRSTKTIVDAGPCLIGNNRSCQLQKRTVSRAEVHGMFVSRCLVVFQFSKFLVRRKIEFREF